MRNFEQELKLQLDSREYGILADVSKSQPQLQTNYYFTAAHVGADVMVRVREKNGTFRLCYKKLLQNDQCVNVCDERECEISKLTASTFVNRGIFPAEINKLLNTEFYEMLTCRGSLATYRTEFFLQDWHLELDKNVYLGKTDYELECECRYIQELYKLKNYLAYNYGIVIRPSTPKSQRFFEALNEKV